MGVRPVLRIAATLLAVGCTACANSGTSASSNPKPQRAAGGVPPSLATACGSASGVSARALWLTTDDKVRLYAIEAGDGSRGVVLAHQGGSNLCEELPYAKTLLRAGWHVLAFDFRGNGQSTLPTENALAYRYDFAAAIKQLGTDGASDVFLIGASMGGAAAVQNSGGLPLGGVVSLSGTRLWPGYGVNKPGPGALRVPFLYIGSRSDSRAPLGEARTIVHTAGSRDKRAIFHPGYLHGWDLVQDAPFAPKTRALILAWMRNHARA
jgi:pimeloyl-ACP methyl ester carboxylesterase